MRINKKKNKELEKMKPKIVEVLKRNKIKKAGIFGSYVHGEQKKDSDVDILVEFKGGLFTLSGIELELERVLKKKVDLLTYAGVHGLLKKRILGEEVRII